MNQTRTELIRCALPILGIGIKVRYTGDDFLNFKDNRPILRRVSKLGLGDRISVLRFKYVISYFSIYDPDRYQTLVRLIDLQDLKGRDINCNKRAPRQAAAPAAGRARADLWPALRNINYCGAGDETAKNLYTDRNRVGKLFKREPRRQPASRSPKRRPELGDSGGVGGFKRIIHNKK
ncbi:hypothetical protein EVAR_55088_1 [Eumeta japonica]|uniref:Uncharacterized protein n=1 Tax=Eumeta variegata TaxID=151549 RepID=A0A4C1YFI3_EUMVA|nr:hypothetical protein EVAR_55088_1 [Eumeta japonica]